MIALHRTSSALFIVAATACRHVPLATTDQANARDAVLRREAQRYEAYTRLDTVSVATLLSSNYLVAHAEQGGAISSRAGAIQAVARHDAQRPIQSITSENARVRLFGGTAVVTGVESINMLDRGKEPPAPLSVRQLFTHVWVLENHAWMLVTRHTSPAPLRR